LGMSEREAALYQASLDGATEAQLGQIDSLMRMVEEHDRSAEVADRYRATVAGLRTEEEERTDTLREQLEALRAYSDASEEEAARAASRAAMAAVEVDAPDIGTVDGVMGDFLQLGQQERELQAWYDQQLEMLDRFREEFAEHSDEWDQAEL